MNNCIPIQITVFLKSREINYIEKGQERGEDKLTEGG